MRRLRHHSCMPGKVHKKRIKRNNNNNQNRKHQKIKLIKNSQKFNWVQTPNSENLLGVRQNTKNLPGKTQTITTFNILSLLGKQIGVIFPKHQLNSPKHFGFWVAEKDAIDDEQLSEAKAFHCPDYNQMPKITKWFRRQRKTRSPENLANRRFDAKNRSKASATPIRNGIIRQRSDRSKASSHSPWEIEMRCKIPSFRNLKDDDRARKSETESQRNLAKFSQIIKKYF